MSRHPTKRRRLYWLERYLDPDTGRYTFRLRTDDPEEDAADAQPVSSLDPENDRVRVLTVDVTYTPSHGGELTWADLALHPDHPNSLTKSFRQ